jgi:nudix-type nucleoside diphosphatase (YffH/AdpP family)
MDIIRTEPVHRGWATFLIATIRATDGQTFTREIEDHGRAACVLPYDPERRTAILVRQFRPAVFYAAQQTDMLEALAGIVEDGVPADCARREAQEETGLVLGALEHVATAWTMPGISTERMDYFLAAYSEADRRGEGGGLAAEHESITVVEMPLSELAAMTDDGRLADTKTLLLVQTLRLKRPELFGA